MSRRTLFPCGRVRQTTFPRTSPAPWTCACLTRLCMRGRTAVFPSPRTHTSVCVPCQVARMQTWCLRCSAGQALCDHMLNRFDCPAPLRRLNSCGQQGLRHWVGQCACGDFSAGDTRVVELIVDALALRRYDLLPFGGYPAAPGPVDLCTAYAKVPHPARVAVCPAPACEQWRTRPVWFCVCLFVGLHADVRQGRVCAVPCGWQSRHPPPPSPPRHPFCVWGHALPLPRTLQSCEYHLNHIMCPRGSRSIIACTSDLPFDYTAFEGTCTCFEDARYDARCVRLYPLSPTRSRLSPSPPPPPTHPPTSGT
jgi:hypothetical protein